MNKKEKEHCLLRGILLWLSPLPRFSWDWWESLSRRTRLWQWSEHRIRGRI